MTSSDGPQRRATLRDVARLARVDPSLVSRVVNKDPKASLLPSTRDRILAAVETLGYQPNSVARGLRMARTWTLGLIVPNVSNPMYEAIIEGVKSRAAELNYSVVLDTHEEEGRESVFTSLLVQGRVDGLLVASGVLGDSFMRQIAKPKGGPVVLVNRRIRGLTASVVMDDDNGVRIAVEHLVALGHKTLVGVFGPSNIDTAQRRRQGFLRACADAGIEADVVEGEHWSLAAGHTTGLTVLDRADRPTAVFAATFVMGAGILRAARERKVRVPRDLSVVALHDSELADYLAPPLDTVAMPTLQMARSSVDLLVRRIEGGKGEHVVVPDRPRLITRASSARPRQSSND